MRLLADENFPKPMVEMLRVQGHHLLWARTDLAGTSDVALLDLAESEARNVLTLDKDFWQITVQRRLTLISGGVVLFRVHPATPEYLSPLMQPLAMQKSRGQDTSASLQPKQSRWLEQRKRKKNGQTPPTPSIQTTYLPPNPKTPNPPKPFTSEKNSL